MPANEAIATYEHHGKTYEIDHLACADFDQGHCTAVYQWGQFAVYLNEEQVGGFAIAEDGQEIPLEFAVLRGSPPNPPVALPVTTEALIKMAKSAVDEEG